MQSSFWKLLTAAGIIGLGTLGVLEVQHRLSARAAKGASAVTGTETAATSHGDEKAVVPDATTDFDRLMSGADGFDDRSESAGGDATSATASSVPAPAADDSTFYGAGGVDRTVRKDELADDPQPFSFDEPSLEATPPVSTVSSSTSTNSAQPDGSAQGDAASEAVPDIAFGTVGSSAGPDDPSGLDLAVPPADSTDATSEIPFAIEPVAADQEPTASLATAATNSATSTFSAATTDSAQSEPAADAVKFFSSDAPSSQTASPSAPNDREAASAVGATDTSSRSGEALRADSTSRSTPDPLLDSAKRRADNSRATSSGRHFDSSSSTSATTIKPASTIQQTAMSQESDDLPGMFVPEPVPDLSRPADDDRRLNPGPASSGSGSPAGRMDRGSSSEPFTMDEPATDPAVPERPESRPPARDEPPVLFDEPLSGSGSGSAEPFGGPGDEPTSTTPDRDNLDAQPLPSADTPVRSGGSRSESDRSAAVPARTVSETMRPQLTIQKRAPNTATVGVSHDYTIVVSNEGDSPALDVVVEDELGTAADLVDSNPVAEFDQQTGILSWQIAELAPRERQEITVRITPTGEGTLDGVATVRFKAQVKSATVITAPKLTISVTGPREVKVGDEVNLRYVISNNGTGDASAVILRSVLHPGLKHPEGGDLEYEIDVLRPGERETVDLTVVAAEPGEQVRVTAEVTAAGVSADQTFADVAIIGSQLSIERLGPERRFVGRSAKYQNIIRNETNFDATGAVVIEQIPDGMKFLSATEQGQYNAGRRQVQWDIAELRAGEQTILEVELVAEQSGQMESIVEVTESAGFRSRATENTVVTVEDIHNVTADISRLDAPVVVGERFGFTITIDNRGTAAAKNVELAVEVPPEIRVLAAGTREVPGKLMRNNVVRYSSVASIPPGESMTFQVTLQGQQAVRNAPVVALLKSDEMSEAMTVSESVTVYDDQP